jgi:hypothetical protein
MDIRMPHRSSTSPFEEYAYAVSSVIYIYMLKGQSVFKGGGGKEKPKLD